MDYKAQLNEMQYEAVTTSSQYCRVIAGAGSGKTRVLTYRIAYLIEERDVNPYQILAITFTNKAANEMKERVMKLVPESQGKIWVMTFHSFCCRFLRQEISHLENGMKSNFTIIDDDDQEKIIKQIGKDRGYAAKDPVLRSLPSYISSRKSEGELPDEVTLGRNPMEKEWKEMYTIYQEMLVSANLLDFDDLLLYTDKILKRCPSVRSYWQERFSHLLIDEFQDTNPIQFDLIKLLLNGENELYVVGDPDQTIYTWRGANQDILLHMTRLFDVETITLTENYRSTSFILNAANQLISHNKKRLPKDLFTRKKEGSPIVYHDYASSFDEAKQVTLEIQRLRQSHRYSEIVLLYRANYLTLPFEKELTRAKIPFRIYGGQKFYQRREVKDVLAYIRLLVNEKDPVSMERIFNVPRRGIGDTSIARLKKEAEEARLSWIEYIEQCEGKESDIPTKALTAMKGVVLTIRSYQQKMESQPIDELMEDLLEEIHYEEYLKDLEDQADERIENVHALLDDMKSAVGEEHQLSLEEYLNNIALMSSQDYVEEEESVTLMTVHTAKGLEFPVVFLTGMNEGIFPSSRSVSESVDGIEEERRLAYVAITRAKEKLYVSSYRSDVRNPFQVPSSFLKEAMIQEKRIKKPSFAQDDFFRKSEEISHTSRIRVPKMVPNSIVWNVGDILIHKVFGEGEVVEYDGKYVTVQFSPNIGRKKLLGSFPGLEKKSVDGGDMA